MLPAMERKTNKKGYKGRAPARVTRARTAARYPLVRNAPARADNFRPLNILSRPAILNLSHRGKLLYNESVTISATGIGVANANVFSANGLYDPNITGTGHQPMSFDQLIGMYEHYTVTNGKITVNFINETKDQSAFVGIGVFPSDSVETISTKLIENGLLKRAYLAPFDSNSKCQCSVTIPFNIAKLNGKTVTIVGDDLYRGDSASNPTEQTYLHVFCYNPSYSTALLVRADVLIEYDAVFTEPRKLAQS